MRNIFVRSQNQEKNVSTYSFDIVTDSIHGVKDTKVRNYGEGNIMNYIFWLCLVPFFLNYMKICVTQKKIQSVHIK